MDDLARPGEPRRDLTTADWARAWLCIGLVVGVIAVSLLLLAGAGCGCTTAPAG